MKNDNVKYTRETIEITVPKYKCFEVIDGVLIFLRKFATLMFNMWSISWFCVVCVHILQPEWVFGEQQHTTDWRERRGEREIDTFFLYSHFSQK